MNDLLTSAEVVHRLLNASSIAIIGASNDGTKASGRTLRYLRTYGFAGRVYPVNPARDVVQGEQAYASIADLPETPDVAVIVLPASRVVEAIEACGAKGIGFAIVFASGYSEIGETGRVAQDELAEAARRSGVRLLGPNCVGAVSAHNAVTAAFMTGLDQDRFDLRDDGIAFVSQSGAMGGFVLNLAQGDGLGVGRFFSTGNEADLDLGQLIEGLVEEGSTRVVLAYVEGVRDGDRFAAALEAAQRQRVPVAVMKVGRSARGAAAAASHTGALAGSDAVLDGLLRRYGAQRVGDVEHLLDMGRVFAAGRLPAGRRVSIVTISGGAGVLMTDYAEDLGLDVFEWQPEHQKAMAEILPSFAAVSNPIDTTGAIASEQTMLTDALRLCVDNPDTDIAIVLLGNLEVEEDQICERISEVARDTDKPVLVAWVGGSGRPRRTLSAAGVPTFSEPGRAMKAAAALADWAEAPVVVSEAVAPSSAVRQVSDDLAAARERGVTLLDEVESKKVLASAGLPVTRELRASTADQAVAAAADLGYPVVVKLLSDEVEHKSDVGGVKLDLTDADAVAAATADVLQIAEKLGLAQREVVVQESVAGGTELILGAHLDPTFGPVVMVGLGGIFTEILSDVAIRPAPVGEDEAARMIAGLSGVALLRGARGLPRCDEAALAALISQFSHAVAQWPSVESIDVNPLRVRPDGSVVALDGVIRLRGSDR